MNFDLLLRKKQRAAWHRTLAKVKQARNTTTKPKTYIDRSNALTTIKYDLKVIQQSTHQITTTQTDIKYYYPNTFALLAKLGEMAAKATAKMNEHQPIWRDDAPTTRQTPERLNSGAPNDEESEAL